MISGNERLIVVFGMAHSGTTILTYVLNKHPETMLAVDGGESLRWTPFFGQKKAIP
jgi:hypothetical protein